MSETLKRIDPPSRPTDGDVNVKLTNRNPEHWYILANPNDDWCGVAEMLSLGYWIVKQSKDGPRVVGGKTSADGDRIEMRGQVLMACLLSEHLERYNAGQQRADMIDEGIKRPGGIDGLRGTTGRLANNATTKDVVNIP